MSRQLENTRRINCDQVLRQRSWSTRKLCLIFHGCFFYLSQLQSTLRGCDKQPQENSKTCIYIFISTKCRLWRNVGCLCEFTIMFCFTYLRKTLTRRLLFVPICFRWYLTEYSSKIHVNRHISFIAVMKVFQKPVTRCLNLFVIFSSND